MGAQAGTGWESWRCSGRVMEGCLGNVEALGKDTAHLSLQGVESFRRGASLSTHTRVVHRRGSRPLPTNFRGPRHCR
eukprot:4390072-Pleurochrysis_carterae.AAC.1